MCRLLSGQTNVGFFLMAYHYRSRLWAKSPNHIGRQDVCNVVELSLECLILKLLNQSCFGCEISPEDFQLFAVAYARHYRAYFVMLSVTVGLPNLFCCRFLRQAALPRLPTSTFNPRRECSLENSPAVDPFSHTSALVVLRGGCHS